MSKIFVVMVWCLATGSALGAPEEPNHTSSTPPPSQPSAATQQASGMKSAASSSLLRSAAKAGGDVALRMAITKAQTAFEPIINKLGLQWSDVEPVLREFDTIDEIAEAAADPTAFLKDVGTKHTSRIALRLAMDKAREKARPTFDRVFKAPLRKRFFGKREKKKDGQQQQQQQQQQEQPEQP